MIRSAHIPIGTAPTPIIAPGLRDIVDYTACGLRNAGANSIFLGGPNVAISGANGGFELTAGSVVVATLGSGDDLFGVVAAGTETIQIMKLRQPS